MLGVDISCFGVISLQSFFYLVIVFLVYLG